MAMKLLVARNRATERLFRVQLDDSQPADGDNVREFRFGKDVSLATCKREIKALCQLYLAQQAPGDALAGEGESL